MHFTLPCHPQNASSANSSVTRQPRLEINENSKMNTPKIDKALHAMALWGSTRDPVLFGHIRVNHRDFTDCGIRDLIAQLVEGAGNPILFVGSRLEIDIAKAGFGDPQSKGPSFFETYSGFTTLLENNRARNGKGPSAWKDAPQPEGWMESRVLPNRVILVISVQPQMPCECAIALVAAIHWAMDISQRQGAAIRVLTMSPEEEAWAVWGMLEAHSEVPPATHFDMKNAEAALYRTVGATTNIPEDIVNNIVLMDRSAKRLVLCFPPYDRVFELVSWLEAANIKDGPENGVHEYQLNSETPEEAISKALQPGNAFGNIVYLPNGFRAPCREINGFGQVHIIMGDADVKTVFDNVTAQITELPALPLSKSERLEQVSWIGRANCQEVFVYLEHPHTTVEAFVDSGHSRRRLEVSNRQLGGFLGALAGMSHWGLDVLHTAKWFVRQRALLNEMVRRVRRQRILVSSPTGLTLDTRDCNPAIFKAVLPILDYDYRLAYFVARHSSDPAVQQIKIQVAAMMCVGLGKVIEFKQRVDVAEEAPGARNQESSIDNDNVAQVSADKAVQYETREMASEDLFRACWGCTRPMSHTGAIWLALGLWKRAAKNKMNFNIGNFYDRKLEIIPGTSCVIDIGCAAKVADIIKAINKALGRIRVGTAQIDIADETGDLTESEQLELQRDLLHAYIHQLAPYRRHMKAFEVGRAETFIEIHDVATLTQLSGTPLWVDSTINVDALLELEGNETVFGVYHGMERTNAVTQFVKEWSWIPAQLVADWVFANANGETLHDWLARGVFPSKNFEEVA
ncbi:hypothetical protein G7Z17_g12686 [Cylindrodendrum hubeiense]|uniref:Uncharacterized protein n=1 Tax=Cylindrodendrum hubeiense TaxID=595255 RepID=A0A9P5H2J0_9HYPO|nr:hypothetical protein G7Z17_g12686 [Cylindrodendrum hubeiense]